MRDSFNQYTHICAHTHVYTYICVNQKKWKLILISEQFWMMRILVRNSFSDSSFFSGMNKNKVHFLCLAYRYHYQLKLPSNLYLPKFSDPYTHFFNCNWKTEGAYLTLVDLNVFYIIYRYFFILNIF